MMAMLKTGKITTVWRWLTPLLLVLATASKPTYALGFKKDQHTFTLGFRPRVAFVDADENARAASALVRLNLSSEWHNRLSTIIEVDYTQLAWEDEFSNGVSFTGKPVIPDVEGPDLNQALLHFKPTNKLTLSLGRETLNWGNQRFVGANGFWQNAQSFDTSGFEYAFGKASHIRYRYIVNANRITGDDADEQLSVDDANFTQNMGRRPARFLGDHEHRSHLVFAQAREWDNSQVQAYYFDMDIIDAPAVSNKTLGARYEFKRRIGKIKTLAQAELALQDRTQQQHSGQIPYASLGLGLGFRANEISFKYEHLGEKDSVSFTSPLASLHDHNGWADKFLATPTTGLRDYSIHYIWRQRPFKIDARYHFFHASADSTRYGEELDIDLAYRINTKNTVLLRYALFEGSSEGFADEERLFFMYTHDL